MNCTRGVICLLWLVAILLVLPNAALCENPLLCRLGESVVEEMNFQLAASGKIDHATLMNSVAFLDKCPGSVMPAFNSFANNREALHHAWISALKSDGRNRANSALGILLAAAHRSITDEQDRPLESFLDGIFSPATISPESLRPNLDHLFEQQSSSTLIQFSHCDAAECYDISDVLLFLLGSHPIAFWSAMHSNPTDASKWLSQLQFTSFSGDPSQAQSRERIRKFLLEQISIQVTAHFQTEKSQCIRTLSKMSYRPWQ